MIKMKFEISEEMKEEISNVTWVSKSKVSSNNENFIGLRFHKITPKIKDNIVKNISAEGI